MGATAVQYIPPASRHVSPIRVTVLRPPTPPPTLISIPIPKPFKITPAPVENPPQQAKLEPVETHIRRKKIDWQPNVPDPATKVARLNVSTLGTIDPRGCKSAAVTPLQSRSPSPVGRNAETFTLAARRKMRGKTVKEMLHAIQPQKLPLAYQRPASLYSKPPSHTRSSYVLPVPRKLSAGQDPMRIAHKPAEGFSLRRLKKFRVLERYVHSRSPVEFAEEVERKEAKAEPQRLAAPKRRTLSCKFTVVRREKKDS